MMKNRPSHGRSRQFVATSIVGFMVFLAGVIPVAVGIFQDLLSIPNQVPVIRLTGGIFTPFLVLLLFPVLVFGIFSAVSVWANKKNWFEAFRKKNPVNQKGLLTVILISFSIMIIQPFATRMVMPRYGYHICQKLDGGISMWHNDWVQKPDWCVEGKTHEWVRAMAAREAGANIDSDEVQRKAKSHKDTAPTRASKSFLLFLGFCLGAALWMYEFRYWESFRRRHAVVRWPLLGAAGLVAGFFTFVFISAGYSTGGDAHWAGMLGLALAVSWPLFGFLDDRPPPPSRVDPP